MPVVKGCMTCIVYWPQSKAVTHWITTRLNPSSLSHPRNRYLPYTVSVNTRACSPLDWSAMQVYRCANGADQSQRTGRSVANEARYGRGVALRIQTHAYICNSAGVAGRLSQ